MVSKVTLAQLKEIADMGVGTSVFQLSAPNLLDLGKHPNQWTFSAFKHKSVPISTNHTSVWKTLNDYLPILAQMGIRKLRLSVEWNYIEPVQGQYDLNALHRYQMLIHDCLRLGIEPMLTFYHFTQPMWFFNKGGFENEANIDYFINYCQTVYQYLSNDVKYWCTINEPAVEVLLGYVLGLFPPHNRFNFSKASMVLKNLLKAHVEVCHKLQNLMHGKPCYLGLVHNVLCFESPWFLIRKCMTDPLTHLTNQKVIEFLETGRFDYKGVKYLDTRYKGNCCFVNIYGNVQVGLLGPTCRQSQAMGDMHLAIYPESYEHALDIASGLKLPIYITETGIADFKDTIRPEFIVKFLRVLLKKLSEGMDIKALFFWTFKDNYEWHRGNTIKFGLFDDDDVPRSSAHLYAWLIKNFQKVLQNHSEPDFILQKWHEILNFCEDKINKNHFKQFYDAALMSDKKN
jgi:beta-glucosidase